MKNILFTSLILLSATTSVNNSIDAYDRNYNLPVAINDNISLINNFNITTIGNIWNLNNTSWFNNEMPAREFLANISASLSESYGESISDYANTYYNLTGQSLTTNRYNYCVVIDSFVNKYGTMIEPKQDCVYFYDVARVDIESESIFVDSIFDINANMFEFNTKTYNVSNAPYNINYLFDNASIVYLKGFICFANTYQVSRNQLDFITQLTTYINYGSKLDNTIIDYKATFKNLTYENQTNVIYQYIYPYYHLNNPNYNALYYKGALSTSNNNAIYRNVVIYDGLFMSNLNNTLYTTIIYNFIPVACGSELYIDTLPTSVKINNNNIFCASNEYVLILNNIEYKNNYTNDSLISYVNNYVLTGTNEYTIKNDYEYLNTMSNIKLIYANYYGINYYVDYNVGALNSGNLTYIKEILLNDTTYKINSPLYRNYLENILYDYNEIPNVYYVDIQYDNTNIINNVFGLFTMAFGSVLSFFNIMIFPNITIGLLLMVPLVVLIITLIVKLFKR